MTTIQKYLQFKRVLYTIEHGQRSEDFIRYYNNGKQPENTGTHIIQIRKTCIYISGS